MRPIVWWEGFGMSKVAHAPDELLGYILLVGSLVGSGFYFYLVFISSWVWLVVQRARAHSDDEGADDYGGYAQTYEDLLWYMDIANGKFPEWLTDNRKIILKCLDMYHTNENSIVFTKHGCTNGVV